MSDESVQRVRLFVEVDVRVSEIAPLGEGPYAIEEAVGQAVNVFMKAQPWADDADCVYLPPMLRADRRTRRLVDPVEAAVDKQLGPLRQQLIDVGRNLQKGLSDGHLG